MSEGRVAVVILAAGASTRLGEPKQTVRLGGERMLERAVRVAMEAGLSPVLVVLGAGAEEILSLCDLRGAEVVVNPGWAEGMGSSLRFGVAALGAVETGVVVMTCDMPAVTAAHLHALAMAGRELNEAFASRYAGRNGVPAYFPAAMESKLRGLSGDAGARALLGEARSLDLPGGEVDVDSPEDLKRARDMICGSSEAS